MSVWFSSVCLCFCGDVRVRLQYYHKICKIYAKSGREGHGVFVALCFLFSRRIYSAYNVDAMSRRLSKLRRDKI